ncbi:hypothetical protein GcC1_065010 [Golovinomyces cichoracearum]|uniref:Uncharacterized protein n=1 Tax=Golovinomyces cichoracearum TaxID=62708 RepID=A0A420IRZ3_9PEZI|nr:hypothetical protein GcC1_065010 [Golovinomyces cichoracearum]
MSITGGQIEDCFQTAMRPFCGHRKARKCLNAERIYTRPNKESVHEKQVMNARNTEPAQQSEQLSKPDQIIEQSGNSPETRGSGSVLRAS